MARPLRTEYPGAFYHVTARGNERKSIFRDDADRERFLNYLQSAVERYKAVIHLYCLMGNHYHLLIMTPDGNLSEIMRHVNGGYTTYSNKRHHRDGHLFQGRYKAILVDADSYAGELSRYIHLNPVRAGMVKESEQYHWSSYAAYIGMAGAPRWLTTDWLLRYFGEKAVDARKAYRQFVRAAMDATVEDTLKEATRTLILGPDDFVEEIRRKYLSGKKKDRDIPALRELTKTSLEVIIGETAREFRGDPGLARKTAIYFGHRYGGRSLREIGEQFGIGESAVSPGSRRFDTDAHKARVSSVRSPLAPRRDSAIGERHDAVFS